jgi:anaerobic selenocysteine-containing dehydrogenase
LGQHIGPSFAVIMSIVSNDTGFVQPILFPTAYAKGKIVEKSWRERNVSQSTREVFRSVCPLDCPDTCGLRVTVEEGRITRVTGDPDHPITRGVICHKVRHFPDRVHHPERLLYPMRRTGEKGEGKFERITWEEALDEITSRMKQLIAEHGAESILPYSYYGNMGLVNNGTMDRRFFHRLGATLLERTICHAAGSQ